MAARTGQGATIRRRLTVRATDLDGAASPSLGRSMPVFSDDADLDDAVGALRFLGDRNRLRILGALARAEHCVLDLIEELGLPQPLVSYHLRKLREAGLVSTRRHAQWVFYSLNPAGWDALVAPLAVLTAPLPAPQAIDRTDARSAPAAAGVGDD